MSSLATLFNCTSSAQLFFEALSNLENLWSGSLEAIQLIVSIVYSFHCVSSVYQQQDNLSAPKCANQSFQQANMIILLNHYTYQSFEQDNIDYESLYLSIIILLHKLDRIIWIHFSIILLLNNLNRLIQLLEYPIPLSACHANVSRFSGRWILRITLTRGSYWPRSG